MSLAAKKPQAVDSIPFVDLKSQQKRIRPQVEKAILDVLDHGQYIMGKELKEFEQQLTDFSGAKHSFGCSDGTDALTIGLLAQEVKPGDAVFVPCFTFASTAEVVALIGATPIFIDVHAETFNIDPQSLEHGIAKAKSLGLNPRGIIAVDLFGQPADYPALRSIADSHNLWIMGDGAQSFGATQGGQKVGTLADITTTSFFPAKPLGCYGDGGGVFTSNDEIAEKIKSIRVHGKGIDKYQNVRIGLNSRLDTMQAAILKEKLRIYPDEIETRQKRAETYTKELCDHMIVPTVIENTSSIWAAYTIRLKASQRDAVKDFLQEHGVPSMVYYKTPLHKLDAYHSFPTATETLKSAEQISHEVLSIPLHAYLSEETQDYIIETLKTAVQTV